MTIDAFRLNVKDFGEVTKQLQHLTETHGYKTTQYAASTRYTRSKQNEQEEIVVRATNPSVYLVEHSRIRNTPLGRKVKSNSVKGEMAACIEFVNSLHPPA